MLDFTEKIGEYFAREKAVIDALDINALNGAMNAIADAIKRDSTIYIFGNGGSAATASHYACDFNKGISALIGKKTRMVCLSDNVPTLTAIANDIGYAEVFRYQLDGVMRDGDLVVAISGSGNSENVLSAVQYAKERGNAVISITGYDGGELLLLADYHMHANVDDMQITEDLHMIFDHMMVRVLGSCMVV